MKKFRLITIAALSILAASCAKEQVAPTNEPANDGKVTLKIFTEGTKTTINETSGAVSWEEGDVTAIMETGQEVQNITPSVSSGTATLQISEIVDAENGYLTGFYPYDGTLTLSEGSATHTLGNGQVAKAGTFANEENPMIGYAKASEALKNGLYFKNICGLIRFKVASSTVTSVKFEGQGGESIAGAYSVKYNDGTPSVSVTSGESAITLSGTFATDTYYYIVALPAELTKGIKVTITDNGTEYVKYGKSSMSIVRNGVVNLGTLTSENSGSASSETTTEWPEDLDFSIAEIYGSVTESDVTAGTATLTTSGAVHIKFNTTVNAVSVAAECATLTSSFNAADGTQWRLAFNFGEVSEETVHTIVVTATAASNGATKTITLTFTQPAPSKTPVLTVANQTISLGASATSTTISVESAYTTWTAEASTGAELSLTSGGSESASQTETITVTIPKNETSSEVSYTVTITPSSSELSAVTVTITQSAAGDEAEWPSDLNFSVAEIYGNVTSSDVTAGTATLEATGAVHIKFNTTVNAVSVAATCETLTNSYNDADGTQWRVAFNFGAVSTETVHTVVVTATASNGATKTITLTFTQPAS